MALYVCIACASGQCRSCARSVVRGRLTKPCSCSHGGGKLVARTTDPRVAGGSIIGPDADGGVLLDTRNAVVLDASTVSAAGNPSDGYTVAALFLEGKLNRRPDRAAVLFLTDAAGAAQLVAQLVGLAARMGVDFETEFRQALDAQMDAAGLWPAVPH